eukprot:TRINITY_DN777817_c0_g1_i1.p1 TRINITY_DN777817_c0_g1~~TRINITY_DN777817_c0_g1_i1.p1  ORF type:complete len:382 (+),score=145.79 TRINITY_DN777817_c0_g1_i1:46-1191(+)
MGIKSLTKTISEEAPDAVKEVTMKSLVGRTVAIDASMAIYQFLVAVRSAGEGGAPAAMLMNEAGEVTSHIQGMLSRTVKLMEFGLKPVWVFDGKAPDMKSGELQKRREMKAKAQKELEDAKERGDTEDIDRFSKRTVSMNSDHQADCKKLLRLMGVPVVESPGEAEAQCAALAKAGKVYAAASEDMDTLTFDAPVLLRRLTRTDAGSSKPKQPILEFKVDKVIEGLNLTREQFVEFCILCGCDYVDSIRGVGPKTALKLIKEHGSLKTILEVIDRKKYGVPAEFPYEEAKRLFFEPDVADPATINVKFKNPQVKALKEFLCGENSFDEERVDKIIDRLKKAKKKGGQQRLDSFFGIAKPAAGAKKRKAPAKKAPAKKRAKK